MITTMDLLISFDTTGSMSSCIREVRKNVTDVVDKMFDELANLRIAIVAHGDYCDKDDLMKTLDFTSDKKVIMDFINKSGTTSGGDYPEAYEYVLKEIQRLSWNSESMRSVVMIGDAYPHDKNDNPGKIDWVVEVNNLKKMGVNIYSVQALNSGNGKSFTFYKQMSNITNGYHLFLDQFSYINDILLAICYKQLGEDRLIRFQQDLARTKYGMNKSIRKVFDTMLGKEDVEEGYCDTRKKRAVPSHLSIVDVDVDVVDELHNCPPAKYQVLAVGENASIKQFVVDKDLTFKTGKGFYQFTKPEKISVKKEIVLMKKDTAELFEGSRARKIAKLTDGDKTYKPSDIEEYDVYIQSTSVNRKLIKDTKFLYEASDWGM